MHYELKLIKTDDPEIDPLLANYISRGIYIQFQDITPFHGVYCYKCFIVDQNGNVIKGTGAGLSSIRTSISALTETPYSYPQCPPSMPCPDNLPYVDIDNLPDYSTYSPENDLELLESVLSLIYKIALNAISFLCFVVFIRTLQLLKKGY